MTNEVDVRENDILKIDRDLLSLLLFDHTTRKNIFWAIDNYADLGEGFQSSDEIAIENVAENFRCCKYEGFNYSIECLTEIFRKYAQYISLKIIRNIELGLIYLKDYTHINEFDDDITVDNKMLYKQKIAKLLPSLYSYYKANNLNIVPIVDDWIRIVEDENEFSDIHNAYINALKN